MESVLITGINGPMGRVIAGELRKSGWNILGTDRHASPDSSLAVDRLLYFSANLEIPEEVVSVAEWSLQNSHGAISLVNNAAFTTEANSYDYAVRLPEQSLNSFEKALKVNLTAPFILTQALAPRMLEHSSASVVNITSTYGLVGPQPSIYENVDFFNSAGYAASKGGLHQLTKYFATILAPQVRVNSVAPGGVERGHSKDFVSRYVALTPLARMNSELDVANAVNFLLSSKASYITGQSISVDGGWTSW